jgi:hypothetical protein
MHTILEIQHFFAANAPKTLRVQQANTPLDVSREAPMIAPAQHAHRNRLGPHGPNCVTLPAALVDSTTLAPGAAVCAQHQHAPREQMRPFAAMKGIRYVEHVPMVLGMAHSPGSTRPRAGFSAQRQHTTTRQTTERVKNAWKGHTSHPTQAAPNATHPNAQLEPTGQSVEWVRYLIHHAQHAPIHPAVPSAGLQYATSPAMTGTT